ncbi:MAG: amino acid adenylation domain-containing protein, partial [Burkholderiales bacterium]|nr:amino acid adenylation domain-containing protein [Burkholderiales bacterium]
RRLLNGYGPTESTVCATTYSCDEQQLLAPPIGRPIANTRIHILDAWGQPCPIGVAGELHIAGAQLARGYLNRPELTAERFVPDPFGAPGSRMYRSGDLARWRADGTLDFLGRNDHQVKIRGFRIELGEIEAALQACPGVRDAVVLARQDGEHKRLVAYLVAEESASAEALSSESLSPEALRTLLSTRLPEYMLPAAYVRLLALPLTPNGKLDRQALPEPDASALGSSAYEPPQGPVEETLAALWCELLGLVQVGRHDDFFALGGHSLLAVQLASRVRSSLGLEVALADLFAHPRLAEFALALAHASASSLPAIVPVARDLPLPLSFTQQRLWFIGLQEHAGTAYSIPASVHLKGSLDVTALRGALDRIVARHEALRATITVVQGLPLQQLANPDIGFALTELDLSGAPDPQAEALRLMELDSQTPFDFARGPLIRGKLFKLASQDHVLHLSMHHIVSDGWSLGVLVNEFSALYAAFSAGLPDPLPALPIQYADFAAWQHRWISGALLQRQLEFWRAHLLGAPALLELPTDRPRPPLQDYVGEHRQFNLGEALTASLKALSQRHGCTLFMTCLASWAVLLSRLTGQQDVVIGTAAAGRNRAEIEPLIGCFVNSLPLRFTLKRQDSVADLLAQTRHSTLAAQANQDIPFEQIVEALNPVRSTAHNPIYQVMFTWQNAPEGELDLPGLQMLPVGTPTRAAQFDLEVSMSESNGCIVAGLGYASALFDATSIEQQIEEWRTLLQAMVEDDSACVLRLPLLPETEQAQLLAFNATETDFDTELCIHQLFEQQVRLRPEATALVFEQECLSYAALNARANQLAHHLVALGVGPDTRVAICLPRSTEMVVALLATLKAGAAYVPLDPAYPAQRLAFMLEDCRAAVLLSHSDCAQALPASAGVPLLWLDAPHPAWLLAPQHDPLVPGLTPAHLAYVIYTSGSTGLPKGVMVAHGGLVNYAHAAAQAYALAVSDRALQSSSVSFDIAVDEIFTTLACGATLVLLPAQRLPDIAEFERVIEQHHITVLNLPTAYWHEWVTELEESGTPLAASLRLVISGGEAAAALRVKQWHRLAGARARWLNSYGPTETVAGVTFGAVGDAETVHIGRPLPNTRIHILDAWGQPCPIGVAGELHIAGAQLARGYLNRPELTAERFVPDPFGAPGSRMYRSGDLARWRADGTLDFLGRNDHQVKIRGFRIELGEIEAALQACPGVREAVVLARQDGDHKRLVAYVVGEEESASPEALRTQLSTRLPEYMLPVAYVLLPALPLTPNGKLDRLALPEPDASALGSSAYEPPQGPLEETLAALWCELLGLAQVGRHDDFFDLGGHSLLAVQLVSRIRSCLGIDTAVAGIFQQPTLHGLAHILSAQSASVDRLPAVTAVSRTEPLPLSFAQQRLWFLAQLDARASAAYLMPGGVRLIGSLDESALRQALDRIVARHEALRTRFVAVEGSAVQEFAPPG